MNKKIRYRIKGKIYYKLNEVQLSQNDSDLVDAVWNIVNAKGEEFRLVIGRGGKRYTLYTSDGNNQVLRTTSISKVVK